jgi:hypothetical protein
LRDSGITDAMKQFENATAAHKNIYGNFVFSPTYEKLPEEKKRVERVAQIEPWGAWEQLPNVKKAVFEPSAIDTLLAQEMDAIREDKTTEGEVVFFKKSDFRKFAQRVHTFIMTELYKTQGIEAARGIALDTEAVSERQGYMREEELYILWLLSDPARLVRKSSITFTDLTAIGSREMFTAITTYFLREQFGFELTGFELVRGKFAFDGFCASEYKVQQEFCEQKPDSPVAKALNKIHGGNFTFADVHSASIRIRSYFEFITFSPVIDDAAKGRITDFLSHYLTDYTQDILLQERNNVYDFKKQLTFTYGLLKKYIDQYGQTFVFELGPMQEVQSELPEQKKSPYLPVHNLMALEAMGFIEIDRIWTTDFDTPPEEEHETYKVRVKILQALTDFFSGIDPKMTFHFESKGGSPVAQKSPKSDTLASVDLDEVIAPVYKPRLSVQKNIGYLHLFDKDTKRRIAGTNTRQFRLVLCLFNPLADVSMSHVPVFQTEERIYAAIALPRDNSDTRLKSASTKGNRMHDIIEYTIKEIQKDKKLRKYLRFERGAGTLRLQITLPEGNDDTK